MPEVPDRAQPGVAMKLLLEQALRERTRGPEDATALTRLEYVAADIRAVRDAERQLQTELAAVLADADQEGRGEDAAAPRGHRESLVRACEGAASRARVFALLNLRDVESTARAALTPVWQGSRGDWSLAFLSGGRVALRAYGDSLDVQNEAPALLDSLRSAGLSLRSAGGSGVRMAEDLAAGHDVEISFPATD
ncbi:hypothetical protein [Actinacidiphila sp. bgisy144]|uniref:hypothetical protein n=1 Tax=Actinacidiphila sp. bgisy144 TaxID=3413791 RepID=UPI003EBB95A7